MTVPKLSVIMPVYNGMRYLPIALESIQKQEKFDDYEILVLDDGSTEPVKEYLERCNDPRLRWWSRPNVGLAKSLNFLLAQSRGVYVARMDSDDIASPSRLRAQYDYLEKNPLVVLVGGQLRYLSEGGALAKAPSFPEDHESIRAGLLRGSFPICHPAVMFRREAAMNIGGYLVEGAGEDLDFFLRLSECGLFSNLSRHVLDYRLVGKSLSSTRAKELGVNYAYALKAAECRRLGVPEPRLEEFVRRYSGASLPHLRLIFDRGSERIYRSALVDYINGRRMRAFGKATVASVLRPQRAIYKISSMVRRSFSSFYRGF